MKKAKRQLWQHLGLSLLGWVAAALLFSFVRLYGVEEESLYRLEASPDHVSEVILAQGLVAGLAFGLLFGSLNLLLDRYAFREMSYWLLILVRSASHVVLALLVVVVSLLISHSMQPREQPVDWGSLVVSGSFSQTALVVIIYTGVISILFNLLRQINDLVGPGVLFNLLTGKYYRPQEEERIFMFLDLKSSTTYAERLGHVLYSELIQDCFVDLTEAIQQHEVEVYQYVGDEAVLTWKVPEGLDGCNCLEAYFTFEATIQQRAKYYFNKYDLVPAFKAGVNLGLVMVAEVGVVKKEIAYHSDVLSTAARIQGQCNHLESRLLISGEMHAHMPQSHGYHIQEKGAFQLRGKQCEICLYSVEKPGQVPSLYSFSS